mgnify:CR=1 FL=1
MKHHRLSVLLAFVAIVLSALCLLLWWLLASSERELARLRAQQDRLDLEFARQVSALDVEEDAPGAAALSPEEWPDPYGPPQFPLPEDWRNGETVPAPDDGPVRPGRNLNMRELLSGPEARALLRTRQQDTVLFLYADLFRDLALPPAKERALAELLLDRQMVGVDLSLGALSRQDPAAWERERQQLLAARRQLDRRIRELLGEEKAAIYDEYQETLPVVVQVDRFEKMAALEGVPLAGGQREALVRVIRRARDNRAFTVDYGRFGQGTGAPATPARVAAYVQALRELNADIVTEAAPILDRKQLEILNRSLEQSVVRQQLRLNVLVRLLGRSDTTLPGEEGAPPPIPGKPQWTENDDKDED